ncbi:hypothetical protein [Solitalea canadensis]|uniref:Uncharacterized protein n=1 Tax=Solitalea canadensis (strain ATCC 29591 / DSM 3403 / JCM 21819 / LMG 8368 / NBRC 15130 / NCIMB 12057 / USAM 9D) TaxID=929556 RepID=H8KT03_SOLCM|nr:hypothetical protein [Solitalea canadensis]AFD05574.1 hypothetical protein Solca_0441 [Solitalea canadensis DSM 3403]
MRKHILYLLPLITTMLFMMIACNSTQLAVSGPVADGWQDSIANNTSIIKIITHLDNKSLRRTALELCEKHRILLDVESSSSQHWYTLAKVKPLERLSMQFQDSVMLLSAEKQLYGLNGNYWDKLRLNTSEWHLSIKQIELLMKGFPKGKIVYNKPVGN